MPCSDIGWDAKFLCALACVLQECGRASEACLLCRTYLAVARSHLTVSLFNRQGSVCIVKDVALTKYTHAFSMCCGRCAAIEHVQQGSVRNLRTSLIGSAPD